MATPSTPPVVDPQQAQIDELKREIAVLQAQQEAQKAARGTPIWWQNVSAWAMKQGGWKHAIAVAYLAVAFFIENNPPAHALYLQLWGHLPKQMVDMLTNFGPLIAWYVGTMKPKPQPQV